MEITHGLKCTNCGYFIDEETNSEERVEFLIKEHFEEFPEHEFTEIVKKSAE